MNCENYTHHVLLPKYNNKLVNYKNEYYIREKYNWIKISPNQIEEIFITALKNSGKNFYDIEKAKKYDILMLF